MQSEISSKPQTAAPKPYWLLRQAICTELATLKNCTVTVETVMAWVIRRSMANSNFCPCDALFKNEMSKLGALTTSQVRQVMRAITIKSGQYKGHPAKFRWVSALQREATEYVDHHQSIDLPAYVLSMLVGLGMVPVIDIIREVPAESASAYLDAYLASEPMQIRALIERLGFLQKAYSGNVREAYAGLLAICMDADPDNRADQYSLFAEELRLRYVQITEDT